ncbi:MAG: D-tyrosyl-tRNA(Tyr) deacylase [Myxococcales bacterium]|nr:D-tyrosyl-tRNA(Tyr) deacylase [Myxococcales bacterium]
MRAVVQRVSRARVDIAGETVGAIEEGLLVLIAAGQRDGDKDLEYVTRKIAELRIFEDDDGRMNRSVEDVGGAILAVSQFTLYGDTRKGRRPSFVDAMAPEPAAAMVERFVGVLRSRGLRVETGRFGADMDVTLTNRGPVTILIDSER